MEMILYPITDLLVMGCTSCMLVEPSALVEVAHNGMPSTPDLHHTLNAIVTVANLTIDLLY